MEIIRKGELPGDKQYEATCWKCNTRFRFKGKEGRVGSGGVHITCPLTGCGATTFVCTTRAPSAHSYFDR